MLEFFENKPHRIFNAIILATLFGVVLVRGFNDYKDYREELEPKQIEKAAEKKPGLLNFKVEFGKSKEPEQKQEPVAKPKSKKIDPKPKTETKPEPESESFLEWINPFK